MDGDGDGDVDSTDKTQFGARATNWYPQSSPRATQAFSEVGNPYMFQGVPHFAMGNRSRPGGEE